ncbi:Alcohol dehydrogenase [hydrothermal vent metagenome]|uniref:Alcohol dehydrogenase n=1 Tax=hydrothermal vent metagenome TaxID=652676 RepID=A0A3B0ZPC3_9ZZZZ
MQFTIARFPHIEFGAGSLDKLPAIIKTFGNRALFVTGKQSIHQSPLWKRLCEQLDIEDIECFFADIHHEPSPQLVDKICVKHRGDKIECVIGLGGGSALDAAKAVAGLLKVNHSVMDFLEGVGPELPYPGPTVPFIAIPTTAGTGSEATKNAVLSQHGEHSFKKSFRDAKLVAKQVILDPRLLASCPQALIAANGMDAITQLMESYTSTNANPFTDSLARSGLLLAKDALFEWYENGPSATKAHGEMAYAAWLSGVTLAQVGLGSVHGLASPLGAFFPIPHGVVCGTLLAAATAINIQAMQQREPNNPALKRYADLAEWLTGKQFKDQTAAHAALITLLRKWVTRLKLPRLSSYQISETDFPRIIDNARGSSMKTNPIVLTDDEIRAILNARL